MSGVRRAPALFIAGAVVMLPTGVLELLRLPDGTVATAATVVASGLSVFLLARTVLWFPLIVESAAPFWSGFSSSWVATRGHSLRLIALGVILSSLVLPLFVFEAVLQSKAMHASMGFIGMLYLLAVGHLHVLSTGGERRPVRLVDQRAYEANRTTQVSMAPRTVARLREVGMDRNAFLRLEYFFRAASEENGRALARALSAKRYSTECRPAAEGDARWCVTGWTVPFAIDEGSVVAWVEEMCALGFAHDCEFDGWGTTPHQREPE